MDNLSKKYNIIDLFSGCGGLTDGFEQTLRYKTLACIDWEKYPCETLARRLKSKWGYSNPEEIVLTFDVQKTDELINGSTNYAKNIGGLKKILDKEKIDIVAGGPPCQAYSIAGRVRDEFGMEKDYRNYLFESYLKIVEAVQPKIFIFENVEGILSAKPGGISIIDRIYESFRDINYIISKNLRKDALFNTADYGVPQNRKRVIIVGVNSKQIKMAPEFALGDFYDNIITKYKVSKKITVKEAIDELPKLRPLKEVSRVEGKKVSHDYNGRSVLNHLPRFHSIRDQEIFKELATDKLNGSLKYPNAKELIKLYKDKTGIESNFHKYNVLDLTKPSNTIPAHLYKDGLRHIHPDPEQSRSITPREAARLQSFDDDFEFIGSMGEQFKMIGNAVPPKFAKAIAFGINEFLAKYF